VLGRTTAVTDPKGNTHYAVYRDPQHEARFYSGWNSGTSTPTGPTLLVREDWANGYFESLTMSAAPAVDGNGRPTGTESVSGLQTLARQQSNAAWQVTQEDVYFNLAGLSYSTSTSLGTENTHFYRTQYVHDAHGEIKKVTTPTGTIYTATRDGLGRVTALSVAPATPTWCRPRSSSTTAAGSATAT
jgi:YD repeat-containing protein